MDDPDYGEPLFGFIEDHADEVKSLKTRLKAAQRDKSRYKRKLETAGEKWQEQVDGLRKQCVILEQEARSDRTRAAGYRRDAQRLRQEIEDLKKTRREERVQLTEWLDRRIAQQENAIGTSYISKTTQANLELEVGLLKRYKEIIVEGGHTKGIDDPLMPRFA